MTLDHPSERSATVRIVDHGTWQLAAADEAVHAPGSELLWNESYYFDFARPDGSLGGYIRLGLYPNWDRAWYWACLVRPGQPTLLVADNAVPLPAAGGTDVAAGSLSASQQVSEPLQTMRVRLAGQAVVLASPAAAYTGAGRGDQPEQREQAELELDLEWTTVGGIYPYRDLPRYEVPCQVAGTVRAAGEELPVSGFGERDHSWGERDWWQISWLWSSGRLEDGTAFHGMQANIGFAIPWPAFAVSPAGELSHLDGFSAETTFGADDFPDQSRLRLPGAPMSAVPLGFAPVELTSPDGRISHFPRALCKFTADDGRTGYGWTEWNQPPGWREHGWSYLGPAGDGQ